MKKINVMVNGIPGNMSSIVARHLLKDDRFFVIPYALTGPEIDLSKCLIDSLEINLIRPDKRDDIISQIKAEFAPFISVDYSHPSSVNSNAEFYCKNQLPFVMGTTGGDRKKLVIDVEQSSIAAVIAPNMAKQIVGFQAMMEYAANTFPNLFSGYSISIKESHQKGKADTSGTAKAMITYFNKLGIPVTESEIIKVRDPEVQKNEWGIPEEYLSGHGWHTYSLISQDKTVQFSFTHNVNGRDVYARGTIDALIFLHQKLNEGAKGKCYSMIDVLKG